MLHHAPEMLIILSLLVFGCIRMFRCDVMQQLVVVFK